MPITFHCPDRYENGRTVSLESASINPSRRSETDAPKRLFTALRRRNDQGTSRMLASSSLSVCPDIGPRFDIANHCSPSVSPQKREDKESPLVAAVRRGNIHAVRWLLDKTGNDGAPLLNHCNENDGQCALHVACRLGNEDMIRLLLQRGASMNVHDCYGDTPLHCACRVGHVEAVRILLEHPLPQSSDGYSGDKKIKSSSNELPANNIIDKANGEGNTALHLACRSTSHTHDAELVRLLLNKGGASVDKVNHVDGETALSHACRIGSPEMVRLLLEHGASADRTRHGHSMPLHNACRSLGSNVDTVRLLLRGGAPVDAVDSEGNTALHLACRPHASVGCRRRRTTNGNVEVIRALLDGGAFVDPLDGRGRRPIMYAAARRAAEVTKLLARRGADLSDVIEWAPSYTANTSITIAQNTTVGRGGDLGEWLLRAAQDFHTQLDFACDAGDEEEIRQLLRSNDYDNNEVLAALRHLGTPHGNDDDGRVASMMHLAAGPWRPVPDVNALFPDSFRAAVEAMRAVKVEVDALSEPVRKISDETFLELVMTFCGRIWFNHNV